METNVVEIIDEQIKIIKKDADLLPQNKVYKIEALEELRVIVSRVELPVKPEIAETKARIEELEKVLRSSLRKGDTIFLTIPRVDIADKITKLKKKLAEQ